MPGLKSRTEPSMNSKLKLSTFQIGTKAKSSQGLRIGATRRPPRGVPKSRWTTDGYFDVWLPVVAPSQKLIARYKEHLDDPAQRRAFFDAYERELLSSSSGRQTVQLLAQIAKRTPISIGCYCADELRCHRSRLYNLLKRAAEQ
jgi:uncharacterized protein YeaO (DUF488 family)